MTTSVTASWSQRHRLGQTRQDHAAGTYNSHHTVAGYRLLGELDLAALRRAWDLLQRRHPVLLSTFGPDGDRWRIDAAAPAPVTVLPRTDNAAAVLKGHCERPFDLVRGPLCRLLIAAAGRGDTALGLAVEHLVSDGWSLQVLTRDLATLYAMEAGADHSGLPPVTLTFDRYVEEQYAHLESPAGRRALDRVTGRVEPVGAVPAMPIEGFSGRTGIRYDRIAAISRRLPGELAADLTVIGRPLGLTALNLAHAALHSAVHLLSGRDTVATTLSTANRELPETANTVGWLASKTVMMSSPGHFPDHNEYLRHFRTELLRTLDDSDLPWPALIARSDPEQLGYHARQPYITFNAIPASVGRRVGAVEFAGLDCEPLAVPVGWHDPSIATFWNEATDHIAVKLQYKTDWYQQDAVERLWHTIEQQLTQWTRQRAVV